MEAVAVSVEEGIRGFGGASVVLLLESVMASAVVGRRWHRW